MLCAGSMLVRSCCYIPRVRNLSPSLNRATDDAIVCHFSVPWLPQAGPVVFQEEPASEMEFGVTPAVP